MFNFAIPRAVYRETGFRAADGSRIDTLTKVRSATRKKRLGQSNRRVIVEHTDSDGTEHRYHATKGWRSYRA